MIFWTRSSALRCPPCPSTFVTFGAFLLHLQRVLKCRVRVTFVPPLIWEVNSPGEVELSAVQNERGALEAIASINCTQDLSTGSLQTGPPPLGWNKIQTP